MERPARVPRETQLDEGDRAAWRTPLHGEAVRKRDMPNDLHPPQLLMRRVGIERWQDTFKMPMLVKEQENVSLCFSADGSPVVEGEATYCISRMETPLDRLRSFVEVDWGAVGE